MLILGVLKPQLGMGNMGVAEAYGDVLFRAWKDLNGEDSNIINGASGSSPAALRQSLEEMLQDVAHAAIHAAEKKYFDGLRTVLAAFHEKKNTKDVDALLLRVYGPILWRSLRSANPIVRSQAALIFFEAFPLQSADTMTAAESEGLLQKQFDLLHTLLKDSDHRVRAVAAFGVCRILREFWEVIPSGTTFQILSYVVSTLGVDGSSAAVRAGVVNGLTELLGNPLAHTVLNGLLPVLANTVHDSSERVRLSFIKLLCKVDLRLYEIHF
jgi:condensin-2 complex subunit G2